MQGSEIVKIGTYRVDLPVLASHYIEVAADTVLVIKGSRLDVPSYHHVEGRVGRLVWVLNIQVVTANSEFILRVALSTNDVLLQHFAAQCDFLLFTRQSIRLHRLVAKVGIDRACSCGTCATIAVTLAEIIPVRFVKIEIIFSSSSVVCHVKSMFYYFQI